MVTHTRHPWIVAPLIAAACAWVPFVAHAQVRNFAEFVGLSISILQDVVVVIIGIAMLFFLWGVAQFILQANNEQKRSEGKTMMVWGIIALFVILSLWGIIFALLNTFDFGA